MKLGGRTTRDDYVYQYTHAFSAYKSYAEYYVSELPESYIRKVYTMVSIGLPDVHVEVKRGMDLDGRKFTCNEAVVTGAILVAAERRLAERRENTKTG